jgi:hypothetical protein
MMPVKEPDLSFIFHQKIHRNADRDPYQFTTANTKIQSLYFLLMTQALRQEILYCYSFSGLKMNIRKNALEHFTV